MRILLSNDDGVYAPGIRVLYEQLSKEHDVTLVAPDRDCSAAGKSLTLSSPIRAKVIEGKFYSVEGTPTDSVHLALTELLDDRPDLVIAGINAGANLGDDTLYSGTVAAATEGYFFGIPAIAISQVGAPTIEKFSFAADFVRRMINNLSSYVLKKDAILNVNIPEERPKGVKVVRLGQRHRAEGMIKSKDPRGKEIYWLGAPGPEQDAGPGTDFHAIKEGYVSITPLQMNLTKYSDLDEVKSLFQSEELVGSE